MDADLYINGFWREVAIQTLSIREGVNGRSTLSASVQTPNLSTVPEEDDEIEFILGGTTTIFSGVLSQPDSRLLDPDGARITRIDASDFSALPERRLVKGATTGGITGRDAIDLVVTNYLAAMGVTRDPSMPTGATLGALTYDYVSADQVLDDIVRLAAGNGWLWRIDELKILRAWAPSIGANPCPWALTDPATLTGDLSIKPTKKDYANRIVLVYNDGTATEAVVIVNDAVEQAARGIYEKAFKAPGPIDAATATAIANSYLTQLTVIPRAVKFPTITPGARAGQTLTINLPDDDLVGDFLITELEIADEDGVDLTYRITAVEGGKNPASWKDTYKEWSGKGSSGLVSTGNVIITVSTPAGSVFSMGGATHQALVPGSGNWLTFVNATPFVAPEDRTVVVRLKLRARSAGVTVTARLQKTSGTPATVNTSSGITSTSWQLTSFSGAVVAGQEYELQISANANDEDVYGIGSMEFA